MSLELPTPLIVVAIVAVVAGGIDIVRFRIPNALTVPLLLSGFIYHAVSGGLGGVENSVAGFLFNFLLVMVFYLMGAMGAGDVKFMAGVGAWLGMPLAAYAFLVAALATAVYSIGILVWQGGPSRAAVALYVLFYQFRQLRVLGSHLVGLESVEEVAKRSDRPRRLVPFAAMVAFGILVIIFWGLGS